MRTGLHQVEDPDGFVEWSTAQPGGALSGRVRAYTGYREDTSGPVHRWETPAGELNLIVSFGDGFRAQARAAANTSNPTPPDQTRGLIGQHRDIGDGRGAVGDRDRHIDACRFLRVRGDLKTADLPTPPGANNVPTDASLSRALPVSALPVGNAA